MFSGTSIDIPLLVRKVPLLGMIQKHRFTWNEVGENLLENSAPKSRSLRRDSSPFAANRAASSSTATATVTAESTWAGVKSEMFRLLATDEPEYDEIRKRLKGAGHSSTLYVLSTLSLWLAGALGISVSVTTPVVATLLYAIAESPSQCSVLLEG